MLLFEDELQAGEAFSPDVHLCHRVEGREVADQLIDCLSPFLIEGVGLQHDIGAADLFGRLSLDAALE